MQKQTLKTGSCDQIESVLKTTIKEEHYTVVDMPGDFYLTHFIPTSSKAIGIMNGLWASVEAHTNYLKVFGADGTNTMFGKKGNHNDESKKCMS